MRQHQAELAHVLRVGTMGQLTAGLAHELNQPLSAILSYASGCTRRLEAGGTTPAELVGAMHRISEQALRAADFIKALRELVRKGEPHREWHDLNTLVRGAIRIIEAELALSGIELELDAAAGSGAGSGQRVRRCSRSSSISCRTRWMRLRELPPGNARTLSVSTAMVRPGWSPYAWRTTDPESKSTETEHLRRLPHFEAGGLDSVSRSAGRSWKRTARRLVVESAARERGRRIRRHTAERA
jgi:hypothetical protein